MFGSKSIAIMQPYFFPYLGYWQLMASVDEFVVYDDIQFIKKGWIHRNRYLAGGKDQMLTLPLKKDSDYLDVFERRLSDSWPTEREKLFRKLRGAYQKAPFFQEVFPILKRCIYFESANLFDYIFNSINEVAHSLNINTRLLISSELDNTKNLKGCDRVVEICKLLDATEYVNLIGGKELYEKRHFLEHGIDLKFHQIEQIVYSQFGNEFISNLSIIDVLMFNGIEGTKERLSCCEIHE
jgi:hypothetical protein